MSRKYGKMHFDAMRGDFGTKFNNETPALTFSAYDSKTGD